MALQSSSPPAGEVPHVASPPLAAARAGNRIRGGSAPPTAPMADRSPKRARRALLPLPAIGLGVALLLAWQIASQAQLVSPLILPTPAAVARAFWQAMVIGPLPGKTLLAYALTTVAESLIGFALGTLIAVPLGYGIARSRLVARTVQPYVAASQAIPAVALAPLLALWLGYGLSPVIALCALIIFFPTVVNTVLGLRSLDADVLDAARVDGAGPWTLLRDIEFPLALPSILAGMRTSLTLSITGAVVGEFVLTDQGLGGLLTIARGNLDPALEFATLLALALLATLLYGVARLAERRFSYLEAK